MALDATPGGSASNSYVTVPDATALLQERLGSEAWYTQDPAEAMTLPARREAALIMATRLLESQIVWSGTPTTMTQALAWPQTGQVDRFGRPIDPTIVPRTVQQATAYYAVSLLEETAAQGQAAGGSLPIKSTKMGDTTITYQDMEPSAVGKAASAGTIPAEVRELLKGYAHLPSTVAIALART